MNNRIHLVDDQVIRKFLARQLVAAGHIVRTAGNGLEGIAKL
jgi:CheY-like chemotaxis protein